MKRRHTLVGFAAGAFAVLLAACIAFGTLAAAGIRPVLIWDRENAGPVYVLGLSRDEIGKTPRPFLFHGRTYLPVCLLGQPPARTPSGPHSHPSRQSAKTENTVRRSNDLRTVFF